MGILPPMCCYVPVHWQHWRMNALDKETIVSENQNLLCFLEPKWHSEIVAELASVDNYSSVLYWYPEIWKHL